MLIVSLKYSPVFSSHIYALYSATNNLGVSTTILCHFRYCSDLIEKGVSHSNIVPYTPQSNSLIKQFFNKDWRKPLNTITNKDSMSCVVMNPHPGNAIFFADFAKIIGGKKFLWLHEPHKTFSELSQYGFIKGIYYFIAVLLARWSVRNIDHCLLPSNYALNRFKVFYPNMATKCSLLPLMFPNLNVGSKERHYFTFVGHVNKGKGIEAFLGLVEYCLKYNLKFSFQIISSSLSEPWLSRAKTFENFNLKIINNHIISDQKIAESIASSFAILCLYTTITQSSVVANAMMQGTPVIASQVGSLPEVILDGKIGYIVQDPYDYATDVKMLELCIARSDYHKNYCLEEFQKSYSIEALKPYLSQILNLDK